MPEFVFLLGPTVGLTGLDLALLIGCPIFAALGTTVSATIKRVSEKPVFKEAVELPMSMRGKNESDMTAEEKLKLHNEILRKQFLGYQFIMRLNETFRLSFIGLVLGLVIALYFVGAITQNVTSLARILALCVLLGYQAPNLWNLQESVFANLIEKKIKELASKQGLP